MKTPSPRRRHPLAPLAVILLALVATGGAWAALGPTERAEASRVYSEASVENGRELFLSNCSTCHGLNAEGTTDGPSLIGVGAAAVDFQVGTGRMPLATASQQAAEGEVVFTDEQIRDMAAYVATLGPGPFIPTEEMLDTTGADVTRGGELFRVNCSMCHNYAGAGGALTEGKYAPKLYDAEDVHIYEAMLTGPQSMPVFADSQISVEDKQSIIAYINAVESEATPGIRLAQLGPVIDGLITWTVGLGAMVACAVWLAVKSK